VRRNSEQQRSGGQHTRLFPPDPPAPRTWGTSRARKTAPAPAIRNAARIAQPRTENHRRSRDGPDSGPRVCSLYSRPAPPDMTISETQAQLEAIQHSLDGLVREIQK
jgi:hypothetical protein